MVKYFIKMKRKGSSFLMKRKYVKLSFHCVITTLNKECYNEHAQIISHHIREKALL